MVRFTSSVASVAALLFTATTSFVAAIPTPDNDPFYVAPAGFELAAPGTVLRSRPAQVPGIIFVNATQLLFRTVDAFKNPAVTVTTVLQGPHSSKNIVVAYNQYEDANNRSCSPSYLYNTNPGNPFGPNFGGEVQTGLQNGWTIVVTDYEGQNSSFAIGHIEGWQTLDGLRAAVNFPGFGLSKNPTFGMYGYSGGAIATGWAAALQPSYAPELNFAGFAFGGIPANVTSTLLTVDGSFFSGFGAGGLAGQISAYPEVQELWNRIATPAGKQAIDQVTQQCAIQDIFSFSGKSILTTEYQSEGANLLYDPIVQKYLKVNTMYLDPSETPRAPLFMYHSLNDEVIPFLSAQQAYNTWCSRGTKIQFLTETGGTGHLGTELAIFQQATNWLDGRLKGTLAAPTSCTNTTTNTGGLPLKKRGGLTPLDIFGKGDEKFIQAMMKSKQQGVQAQAAINGFLGAFGL